MPCLPRPIVGRGATASFAFSVEVLEAKVPELARAWVASVDDWLAMDNDSDAFQGVAYDAVVVAIESKPSCHEAACDGSV